MVHLIHLEIKNITRVLGAQDLSLLSKVMRSIFLLIYLSHMCVVMSLEKLVLSGKYHGEINTLVVKIKNKIIKKTFRNKMVK